jgi:hypothetical protein
VIRDGHAAMEPQVVFVFELIAAEVDPGDEHGD